jgi:hypothetical protein
LAISILNTLRQFIEDEGYSSEILDQNRPARDDTNRGMEREESQLIGRTVE